jgi:predicted AlkP superfamily phosphohydrolase/phosphomutase
LEINDAIVVCSFGVLSSTFPTIALASAIEKVWLSSRGAILAIDSAFAAAVFYVENEIFLEINDAIVVCSFGVLFSIFPTSALASAVEEVWLSSSRTIASINSTDTFACLFFEDVVYIIVFSLASIIC